MASQASQKLKKNLALLGWFVVILAIVAGLLLADMALAAASIKRIVTASATHIPANGDGLKLIENRITRIERSLNRIARDIRILRPLEAIPSVATSFDDIRTYLAVGERAVEAGKLQLRLIEKISGIATSDLLKVGNMPPETRRRVITVFTDAHENLIASLTSFDETIGKIKEPSFPVSQILQGIHTSLLPKLQIAEREYQRLIALEAGLPKLLGFDGAKKYLLLFQNSNELRPTGGFIGSYALVTSENGTITSLATDNIYNLDNRVRSSVRPPEPVARYLIDRLYVRDANWLPNFPETGALLADLFRAESGTAVEAVIALTPRVVETMVAAVGPLTIPGVDEKLTAETITSFIEREVGVDAPLRGEGQGTRKAIIGVIAETLLAKIRSAPAERQLRLLLALGIALDRKDIQVWFKDGELQKLAALAEADGALPQTSQDFLMLVEANLGGRKSDPHVARTLTYTVDLTAPTPSAELTVTYTHDGTRNELVDAWRGYVRLYAPRGSWLTLMEGGEAKPDYTDESGYKVFGTFLSVPVGEERTLRFRYDLPTEVIREGTYTLTLTEQAGTLGYPATVKVRFPRMVESVRTLDLYELSEDGTLITYHATLNQNQTLTATF
ncbi:MAG: DUF4012 domain-containing protein [Parcubacteria group bacterium]|nr:DUF4012 domain-containing protein [Parcubacteria group bacterium]